MRLGVLMGGFNPVDVMTWETGGFEFYENGADGFCGESYINPLLSLPLPL